MEKTEEKNKKKYILILLVLFLIGLVVIGTTYAFFQFTKTGNNNVIETSYVSFDYIDGTSILITNDSPISVDELTDSYKLTFSITAHNNISNGVTFNVYAIYGAEDNAKTRLDDGIMSFKFIPPSDGDGFYITNNYYSGNGANLNFTDGKALIATGVVRGTLDSTTKTYSAYLWVDENKVLVSSTTKRENNMEGYPSLADTTGDPVTVLRYMKNNTEEGTMTKIYPAKAVDANKKVYTTNEYKNAYYSLKIRVEAFDTPQS